MYTLLKTTHSQGEESSRDHRPVYNLGDWASMDIQEEHIWPRALTRYIARLQGTEGQEGKLKNPQENKASSMLFPICLMEPSS